MKPRYRVDIIESERGWGQKVDETRHFKTKAAAEKFVKEYNAANNKPVVPEIYWKAVMRGLVDLDERSGR